MKIIPAGTTPSRRAPADYFTGTVWQEPLSFAEAPGRAVALSVTFEPGARTAWHTHPLGQSLYVTAGSGFVQSAGGPKIAIRAGDAVWIPPGEKHWHGAGPTTTMTHLAIGEALDGATAHWLEQVSDEDYSA